MAALWRVHTPQGERLARGPAASGPKELLAPDLGVDDLLRGEASLAGLDELPAHGTLTSDASVLAPLGGQDVWAAGVTYLRSRDARLEESDQLDAYDRVYDAERPEIFFKAAADRVRGPGEPVGVRSDSEWDVPEPELGVVADATGSIVAYVIGNDVSSRSIEGENPLYLPQAKVYTGSCAIGPCLVPLAEAPPWYELEISLRVNRDGRAVFDDTVQVRELKRSPQELVSWLFAGMDFPVGVVLLTGTAIVPPSGFTLSPGDEVRIAIHGLGALENPVEQVGTTRERVRP
ncbi:fumarylacetoacetate hydrolase [Egibacter rhizosphaerae]|uniref:Fumarylacetoacetate hydrolase n=1 Tax=Egibacter rhizosphaerae TaxID=1670831 RepID=A0A411YBK4_9ACTN|nr:fumarylacetoacetate hydrolase family protein [Egibacter rhizosphaerae]QBI18558.1 fumarylacetoacetate hydrolase [Egibacter rhizosphaerae]